MHLSKKNEITRNVKHWVFDLDNTLYPAHCNLFEQVDKKMAQFIARLFDISLSQAKKMQKYFFQKYGTTLRGLMTEHNISSSEYLKFVHDIDFSVLKPDEVLNQAIMSLPGDKFIYTNASTEYTHNVLRHIGLSDHFGDIFDIHDAEFLPKPDVRSYHKMIAKFSIDPKVSVMVEDLAGNLNPAAELGMTTVWVTTEKSWSKRGYDGNNIHHVTSSLPTWLSTITNDLE